ncbi:MAG: ABC transporter substrate-binding protein [Chloroflexota bacterium]
MSPSDQALAEAKSKYYEAAQKEGKLVLYGNSLTPALFDSTKAAFAGRFPGIELSGTEMAGRDIREKVIAEQASKNYVADIALMGFTTQRDLTDAGLLEAYESPQVSALFPQFVVPGGVVNPRNATLISLAVNTNLVPPDQEPKVWDDVLDPKWKGKIAVLDPRGSGEGGTIVAGMELVYGLEWSSKLKAQEPFFANATGPLWTGLVRGEYAMYLSARHVDAIVQRKAGAPVKFVKPKDGVGWTYSSMGNIKNQPHPNAARLFIEWTLSAEGQGVLSKEGFVSVRPGLPSAEPEAGMEGVTLLPRDQTPEANEKLGDDKVRTKRWDTVFFN